METLNNYFSKFFLRFYTQLNKLHHLDNNPYIHVLFRIYGNLIQFIIFYLHQLYISTFLYYLHQYIFDAYGLEKYIVYHKKCTYEYIFYHRKYVEYDQHQNHKYKSLYILDPHIFTNKDVNCHNYAQFHQSDQFHFYTKTCNQFICIAIDICDHLHCIYEKTRGRKLQYISIYSRGNFKFSCKFISINAQFHSYNYLDDSVCIHIFYCNVCSFYCKTKIFLFITL